MSIKVTKFCKQKCYILTFFCFTDDPVKHKLILLYVKGTRAVPGKQKASAIGLVVDNLTNNSSFNFNKISVFRKRKYCFHRQKKGTTAKKVILRDPKEDVDKVCIEVQKPSDNAGVEYCVIICDITIFTHLHINLTNVSLICSYDIKTGYKDDKNKLKQ